MKRLLGLGLGIVVAFFAGCGGGGSSTAGLGTLCSSDAQCAAAGLLCGPDQRCVECTADSDCRSNQQCSGGLCQTGGASTCSSNADCGTGTVCDTTGGQCVQCVRSSDCQADQTCVSQACVASTACSTSSDCPSTLVCDATAGTCVECVVDRDCAGGKICSANQCTPTGGTGGAAGASNTGGTGGISSGGTNTGGTGTGGTGTGGTSGCSCPTGQACLPSGGCIDARTIDDFADCNTAIYEILGRKGAWYGAADVGINVSFAVGTPPTGYSDRRCGAWTIGGPTGNGTTSWALLGVTLANGANYDLSTYTGLTVALEAQSVDFTVKTGNGGYFTTRLPTTAGTQSFDINFSSLAPRSDSATQSLDLTKVTDIQFTVIDPTVGYGFVIHGLYLR